MAIKKQKVQLKKNSSILTKKQLLILSGAVLLFLGVMVSSGSYGIARLLRAHGEPSKTEPATYEALLAQVTREQANEPTAEKRESLEEQFAQIDPTQFGGKVLGASSDDALATFNGDLQAATQASLDSMKVTHVNQNASKIDLQIYLNQLANLDTQHDSIGLIAAATSGDTQVLRDVVTESWQLYEKLDELSVPEQAVQLQKRMLMRTRSLAQIAGVYAGDASAEKLNQYSSEFLTAANTVQSEKEKFIKAQGLK